MEDLLEIARSLFADVLVGPAATPEYLYGLVTLANKYDMVHLLRPWAVGWASFGRKYTARSSSVSNFCDWQSIQDEQHLVVAWSEIDDSGRIVPSQAYGTSGRHLFQSLDAPTAALELVGQTRLDLLTSMLERVEAAIRSLAASTYAFDKFFRASPSSDQGPTEDNIVLLGTLKTNLSWIGLYPIPEAEVWPNSGLQDRFPPSHHTSTAQPAMASVTTIDEEGDLLLLVGSELSADGVCPETFKVDSRTLCRASKVFKVMLRGPFSEGKKRDCDSEWLVKLPEDRPKPMTRILEIIHGNFNDELPNLNSDVRALYELTILTDKYNLAHLLKPWASQWACKGRNDTLPFSSWDACKTFDRPVLEQYIWIACELGDMAWFTQLLKIMAMRNDIDACGELIGTFESSQEPKDAYYIIKELRLKYLKSMLGRFEDAVEHLVNSEPSTDPYYSCQKWPEDMVHTIYTRREIENCRALLLGSLIMCLRKKDLWPIPDGQSYCSSPADLKEHMIELRAKAPEGHSECGTDIGATLARKKVTCGIDDRRRKDIMDRLAAIEVQLSDVQKRHLQAQAEKSGLKRAIKGLE
ncbi:hypothetical protein SUNI508_07160 [Seiridium unicorne]|uniref:BTB domain-containing protein n=1 Tax=Seiridium unicorne TaxID=138068 RepID=A0ABR2UYA5_9PEZI